MNVAKLAVPQFIPSAPQSSSLASSSNTASPLKTSGGGLDGFVSLLNEIVQERRTTPPQTSDGGADEFASWLNDMVRGRPENSSVVLATQQSASQPSLPVFNRAQKGKAPLHAGQANDQATTAIPSSIQPAPVPTLPVPKLTPLSLQVADSSKVQAAAQNQDAEDICAAPGGPLNNERTAVVVEANTTRFTSALAFGLRLTPISPASAVSKAPLVLANADGASKAVPDPPPSADSGAARSSGPAGNAADVSPKPVTSTTVASVSAQEAPLPPRSAGVHADTSEKSKPAEDYKLVRAQTTAADNVDDRTTEPSKDASTVSEPQPIEPARVPDSTPAAQPITEKSSKNTSSPRPEPVVPPRNEQAEEQSASEGAASDSKDSEQESGQERRAALPVSNSQDNSSNLSFAAPQPEAQRIGTRNAQDEPIASDAPAAEKIATGVETNNAIGPQPAREISLRLTGEDSTNIDVQLRQRAGQIQVAVRTDDPQLARSLQTDLGDLVGRLDNRGYKTEVWTPVAGRLATAMGEQSGSSSGQGQPQHSGSGSGQQQKQEEKNQSNQRQQPKWMAQLEETLSNENARTENE